MTKTKKARITTAVLGSGSENTIDIAPGVDFYVIIAEVFGILQGGADRNFLFVPAKDHAVEEGVSPITSDDGEGGIS